MHCKDGRSNLEQFPLFGCLSISAIRDDSSFSSIEAEDRRKPFKISGGIL